MRLVILFAAVCGTVFAQGAVNGVPDNVQPCQNTFTTGQVLVATGSTTCAGTADLVDSSGTFTMPNGQLLVSGVRHSASGSGVTTNENGSGLGLRDNGGGIVLYSYSGTYLTTDSGGTFNWSPSSASSGSVDTGLSRPSAGIVAVGTGTQGSIAGTIEALEGIFGGSASAGSWGVDVQKCGSVGCFRVKDLTATTGATKVLFDLGAADSNTTNIFTINGTQKFGGNNTTAAVAGIISTTCPAVTCTAAYTWVQAVSADGSTVYFPVWK